MTTDSEDNVSQEFEATPELISSAIETAKSEGMDVNPYSIALVAGIAPQAIFTNSELMHLVLDARGDGATFSIDIHLVDRCQELESEMAKVLEVNQEIYDRALEMEERVIQLETKLNDAEEENEHLTMQLQNSWHLGYKKGVSDTEAKMTPASKPLIDIELPKEEKEESKEEKEESKVETEDSREEKKEAVKEAAKETGKNQEVTASKPIIDIELPKEVVPGGSLLDIALPEAEKLSNGSHAEAAPESKQGSIKDFLDIELPKEEKKPKQSIKTMIDFELPREESLTGQAPDSATEAPAKAAQEAAAAAAASNQDLGKPSYNDKVFNAVSDSVTTGSAVESYGALSWREVETIYQYSSTGGANSTNPNMVFEPMSPGQSVGAGGAEAGAAASTAPGFGRADTQPMRTDTQPIVVSRVGGGGGGDAELPPILKADAPSPAKPNPRSTFTGLSAKSLRDPDPPMEQTMSQFLGDTNSYINLDRVTMAPDDTSLKPKARSSESQQQQPTLPQEQAPQPAPQQEPDQVPEQVKELAKEPDPAAKAMAQAQAQAETQTLQGATQAIMAEAKARAEGAASPSAGEAAKAPAPEPRSTGPSDAKWGRRDADVTFDGLAAMDDSTADVLDLEKLDIFEGIEDIDELSHIEVIEDVVLPDATPVTGKGKAAEHGSAVSSDDLHDLIKSRIKKAEDAHEPPRFDRAAQSGTHSATTASGTNAGGTASSTNASAATGSGSGTEHTASSTGTDEAKSAPIPSVKELDALRQNARNKFVGGKAASSPLSGPGGGAGAESPIGASNTNNPMMGSSRGVPPEIRKACMILGVRPENLTAKEVNEKWKAQLSAPGVHPDQGGDTESAIYLNTAKDTLVKWINDQDSKLGKKFGKKDDPPSNKK